MMKKIIGLILIMSVISACHSPNQKNKPEENTPVEDPWIYETDSIYPSQNNVNQPEKDCYSEKIKLCIDLINNTYKDTVLYFRNYVKGNDRRRIVCNIHHRDKDLDDLICESRYVWELGLLDKMNLFSFIIYSTGNHGNTIVKYFLCDRESKETLEINRLLVKDKKIIGVMLSPGIGVDRGFMPEGYIPPGEIRI